VSSCAGLRHGSFLPTPGEAGHCSANRWPGALAAPATFGKRWSSVSAGRRDIGVESPANHPASSIGGTYSAPDATPEDHRAAIAAAAKELNDLRERWLNPPEWTETRILEFPGSVGGPWDRYIDKSTIHEVGRGVPSAPSSKAAGSESQPQCA